MSWKYLASLASVRRNLERMTLGTLGKAPPQPVIDEVRAAYGASWYWIAYPLMGGLLGWAVVLSVGVLVDVDSVAQWPSIIKIGPLIWSLAWLVFIQAARVQFLKVAETVLAKNAYLFCPDCGFDLRGDSAGGRCPECGAEVTTAALPTSGAGDYGSRTKLRRSERPGGRTSCVGWHGRSTLRHS